jgi:hypothetical protein
MFNGKLLSQKGHQMSEEIGDWGMLQLEIVKMKMQM